MTKYCNFCGEPMRPDAMECKQCGWDVSKNAPQATDPGDTKARLGVMAATIVAYGVMAFLIQLSGAPARSAAARPAEYAHAPEPTPEPVRGPEMAISALSPGGAPITTDSTAPSALISMKVADIKSASIPARDALQYSFVLPETDQKCRLVGSTRGIGGFGRNVEVFLLTDDEYVFWHANPAAIAASKWKTFRGSETTLQYELGGPGTYHFVVSNLMSPTPQLAAVKAYVECVK